MVESEDLIREILRRIGEDVNRPGIAKTPARVVRSWREIFGGYQENAKELLETLFDEEGFDEMVVLRNIEFYSTCEHHMLPFYGVAHIGYLPSKQKVIGVSKLARLTDLFAQRLQVQERLTRQIAQALMDTGMATGVGVTLEAKHQCMSCRGVRKQGSELITSVLLGTFRDDSATRQEFLLKTPVRTLA